MRWIAFDEDLPMLHRWWRATFGLRARLPATAAYVRDLVAMKELVEAGVGIAVLPDYLVEALVAEGRLREVYPRPRHRVQNVIALAWRSSIPLRGRHVVVRDALIGDTRDHQG
jgi:DNA-binding transcriptional LysR family regulator